MPEVNILDLGGIAQVFKEAKESGVKLELKICGEHKEISSSIGLSVKNIQPYSEIKTKQEDYVFIISSDISYILSDRFRPDEKLKQWFYQIQESGVTIAAVCNAAFLLGRIGLLDHIKCTTHWKRTQELQQLFPRAVVMENLLFIEDNRIITSAGSASGIDLALHVLSRIKDDRTSNKIARELVVFNRRSGLSPQESIFLKYRKHYHIGIHRAQDFIESNLSKRLYLFELAEIAGMSERNFCRIFKKEISLTVFEYITLLRQEKILELLQDPNLSKRQIANMVGLESERQVNRIMHKPQLN